LVDVLEQWYQGRVLTCGTGEMLLLWPASLLSARLSWIPRSFITEIRLIAAGGLALGCARG